MKHERGYRRNAGCIALAMGLLLVGGTAPASQLYRWVDDSGTTHLTQLPPPNREQVVYEVLNERGIVVRRHAPDPERSADPATRQQAEAQRLAAEREQRNTQRRDAMLLSAYLSVDDIKALRDQRLDQLDSQVSVTEYYLDGLRERLERLRAEAQQFRPYNEDPDAPEIDERLAAELAQTLDSIASYESSLYVTQERRNRLKEEFKSDIARFLELRGDQAR